ncbi:MAG: hypothetical protein QUS12_06020, partial [Methanosarcina sp.]|nr:hypothetical protein [Methanosarcina sp.]
MNRRMKVFGGLILAVLLLLVLGSWYMKTQNEKMYDDSLTSHYDYGITITSNRTLHNVTLYLPVPVFENESEVGLEIVNGDYYNKPSDWNLSLENTEYGLMLKIEAAEI